MNTSSCRLLALLLILGAFIRTAQCGIRAVQGNIIPSNYSRDLPPPPAKGNHTRLHVEVSIQFINLLEIDELGGSFQYSCFYRVYWADTRLAAQNESIGVSKIPEHVAQRIWRPDIITENVRIVERNGIIKPTIFSGKLSGYDLFISTYLAMTVGCQFQYQSYPMDVQICKIHVTNMGMTTDILDLQWSAMGYTMSREAFLSYQGLFDVKICEDSRSPVRKSRLGNHPQKTLLLILERNYMAYVVQVFLPSIFFVLIAWLSILIPPTMLRTRLLLNSTNLLTILSMFLAVSKTESASIPKVSYLTALNLWMFVCVSFTFTSVLLVIFDIRLISLLTNSVGKLQPIKRVLLDVYQQSSGGRGRRGTEFAAELDYLAHLHQAAIEASASARGSGSWSEDGSDKPEAAQDDDGDLFEDASGVTPVPSFEAPRPGRVEVRVRRKRRLWLEMTAFYERLYLLAFPALFVLFLIVFVSYYRWTRHVQLDSLMEIVGRGESFYPGCWCARGDSWAGCMPESEYEKLK